MWTHFVVDFASKTKPKCWLSSGKPALKFKISRDIIMKYLSFAVCHENKLSSLLSFRHRIMDCRCVLFHLHHFPSLDPSFTFTGCDVCRVFYLHFGSVFVCNHLLLAFTATWCFGKLFWSNREREREQNKMYATIGKQAIILIYCDQLVCRHLTTINWREMQVSWYRCFPERVRERDPNEVNCLHKIGYLFY